MSNYQLKELAKAMRKKGKSIKDIAQIYNISTSTVSYWCRDIALTFSQIKNLQHKQAAAGARGRLVAAEKKREERFKAVKIHDEIGRKNIGLLGRRDLFMLGLGLYWGEGYKKGNEECGLTNSDPDIIKTYIKWLAKIYGVQKRDLIARLSINSAHKTRVGAVEQYWSSVTGIPISQFTKTSLIRTSARKMFPNPHNHFGTLRVKVRRATNLRRRIMGSIKELRSRVR